MEPDIPTSVRRQRESLGINRSSLYYQSAEPDAEALALTRRIDEVHLELPFYGSRRMAQELRGERLLVNRKRVQRLMRITHDDLNATVGSSLAARRAG